MPLLKTTRCRLAFVQGQGDPYEVPTRTLNPLGEIWMSATDADVREVCTALGALCEGWTMEVVRTDVSTLAVGG